MALGQKKKNHILNRFPINTKEQHSILSIKNLSIGYSTKKKQITIAQNINIGVSQGELCAIVGVNGIGKSTLLRTLGNVQPKLSGDISLKGKPLEEYQSNELATEISIVLTESIASKNLTVIELIALGRQPYTNWIGSLSKTDKEKIKSAIQMIGLEELQHKKCYELSDGQLQKVMIARAVAQDTSIMLLDEPTTHLDLYHKAQILKLLQQIAHETNKTIVFTTHEIELGIQLADKMLVLENDKTNFGTPKQLIKNACFESLFPKDTIRFDATTGSFKIKK